MPDRQAENVQRVSHRQLRNVQTSVDRLATLDDRGRSYVSASHHKAPRDRAASQSTRAKIGHAQTPPPQEACLPFWDISQETHRWLLVLLLSSTFSEDTTTKPWPETPRLPRKASLCEIRRPQGGHLVLICLLPCLISASRFGTNSCVETQKQYVTRWLIRLFSLPLGHD